MSVASSRQWNGKPVTKPSSRKTDRAPHMGEYVRVGKRYGKDGVHLVIGSQGFFIPTLLDDDMSKSQIKAHVQWHRDMLCIALDSLVQIEMEKRK